MPNSFLNTHPFSKMCTQMAEMVEEVQVSICDHIAAEDTVSFQTDVWERPAGGGGITKVINGTTIEKGGVNTSRVYGEVTQSQMPVFAKVLKTQNLTLDTTKPGYFYATGISLVLHPKNPHVPTSHANYRYFEFIQDDTSIWWFGGGADLTPYYLDEDDARHFHTIHKLACDHHDSTYYPRFKADCDRYFLIEHRNERRGVGGIFFDHLHDKPKDTLFAFAKECAHTYIPAYLPIVQRHKNKPFTPQQKYWQEIRRGRYVEFNLVYDRGTLFGFKSGGRTESILMSLPNTCRWEYDHHPKPNSPEAALIDVLKTPREWA